VSGSGLEKFRPLLNQRSPNKTLQRTRWRAPLSLGPFGDSEARRGPNRMGTWRSRVAFPLIAVASVSGCRLVTPRRSRNACFSFA
jgi:hypothetical protein